MFPALNIQKSDTRKGELLYHPEEIDGQKQEFPTLAKEPKQVGKIIISQTSSTQNGRSWHMKYMSRI
jgi:transcription termination factor Rho